MANSPTDRTVEIDDGLLRANILLVLTVVGSVLGFATSVFAARLLGTDEFEDYAVAVATLGLLTTISEAGVGKYAMKVLPRYRLKKRWGRLLGYYRYSAVSVLLISVALAAVMLIGQWRKDGPFTSHPAAIAALFLPLTALSGVGIDLLMANRMSVFGSLVSRFLIPGSSLAVLFYFWTRGETLNSMQGVAIYGLGSVLGAILCWGVLIGITDSTIRQSKPVYRTGVWMSQGFYFAVSGFLGASLFRLPIIAMEMLPIAETQVAYFAAASEIGLQVLLLSKSTDKLYQPQMSVLVHQRDIDRARQLSWKRHLFIGSLCAIFMTVVIVFGRWILRLYGDAYVAGYPALCLVSAGGCVTAYWSLAPAYLRFVNFNRFVIACEAVAAIALLGLTAVLAPMAGATGTAAAFLVVISALTIFFAITASRHLYHPAK
ncbi:lipopolysaccharide biosynthesis protein [Crateriforma spongiae]|uniref:lipopolysaccharide biosynthesis protein n=1 Tax=Crateriforma spongiae TaxID=2724528 RepID=UPI0039B0F72E